jgi:hypothetical protein
MIYTLTTSQPHLVQQSHYLEPWDGTSTSVGTLALYSRSVLAQTITDQSSILTRNPMDDYDLPDDIRDILADPSEEEPILTK